jgi:hypothetical protein
MFTQLYDIDKYILPTFLSRKELHCLSQVSNYAYDISKERIKWIRINEYVPIYALFEYLIHSVKRVYRIHKNENEHYNDIDSIVMLTGQTQERYIKYKIKNKLSQHVLYSCDFRFVVREDKYNIMSLYVKVNFIH